MPRKTPARHLSACPEHRRCFAALAVLEVGLLTGACLGEVATGFIVLSWGLGLCGWSIVEYLLHRFVFHLSIEHPLACLGARLHHEHHRQPEALPITKPLRLTLPVLVGLGALASPFGPLALAVIAGLVGGYLLYELAHVAAHVLGDRHPLPHLRAAHLRHHRHRVDRDFGITSTVWDLLCKTRTPADPLVDRCSS